MARLEVALIIGEESKLWLENVTEMVERMERAVNIKGSDETKAGNQDDVEAADDDEDFAPKKRSTKSTVASFDDDTDDAVSADGNDDEDEEVVPKAKKAKKLTVEDVNDACKKKAKVDGRDEVLSILKKKFKTKTVSDLKPEQYAAVIAAMKA